MQNERVIKKIKSKNINFIRQKCDNKFTGCIGNKRATTLLYQNDNLARSCTKIRKGRRCSTVTLNRLRNKSDIQYRGNDDVINKTRI